MGKKESILKGLVRFKNDASKDIKIKQLLFFGSRAVGRPHRDSDIDLVIVSDNFKKIKPFKRAIKLYDYWNLDFPVDFLCLTPQEFEKKKREVGIIQEAVKKGIVI